MIKASNYNAFIFLTRKIEPFSQIGTGCPILLGQKRGNLRTSSPINATA